MAPKETKKDKERRAAKKAEELTVTTDDAAPDEEPDEGLQYDAEGGLLSKAKAGTSAEACAVLAATTDGDYDNDSSNSNEAGVASQEEKAAKKTKRVSSRSCS
jgi:hypothetical protein